MTATTAAASTPIARENREPKARAIALYAWRVGLGAAELWALPYSSHRRTDRTRLAFTREAYTAAGKPQLRLPGGPNSDTWDLVAQKLTAMARLLGTGDPRVPPRDLLHLRPQWLTEATGEPPYGLPRGWAELAALPPLGSGSCLHHPDRRPIVVTIDGGRCAECPPRQGTGGGRDGWGVDLDWTPKPCRAPGRCYCGRCPTTEDT